MEITLANTLNETDAARRIGYSLRNLKWMRKNNPYCPRYYVITIGSRKKVRYVPSDLDKWVSLAQAGAIPNIRGARHTREYVRHINPRRRAL